MSQTKRLWIGPLAGLSLLVLANSGLSAQAQASSVSKQPASLQGGAVRTQANGQATSLVPFALDTSQFMQIAAALQVTGVQDASTFKFTNGSLLRVPTQVPEGTQMTQALASTSRTAHVVTMNFTSFSLAQADQPSPWTTSDTIKQISYTSINGLPATWNYDYGSGLYFLRYTLDNGKTQVSISSKLGTVSQMQLEGVARSLVTAASVFKEK